MDLEAKIEERKKEAREKNIFDKARDVAKYLGSEFREHHKYNENNFSIEYSKERARDIDFAGHEFEDLTIKSEGEIVFSYGDFADIRSYAPGNWEDKFEELYASAIETKEKVLTAKEINKKKKERKEKAKLRQKWSL